MQLVGMRLSERFTLYVHEDANSARSLATTRRAAEEAGRGRVAEVLSSVAAAGSHPFERGGLHKISEHFHAALAAVLSPPRAHSHAVLVGGRTCMHMCTTAPMTCVAGGGRAAACMPWAAEAAAPCEGGCNRRHTHSTHTQHTHTAHTHSTHTQHTHTHTVYMCVYP